MTTPTPTDTTKCLTLVYRITSTAQQTKLLAEGQWVASAHSDVLAERDALQRRVDSMEQKIELLQRRVKNVNDYHQAWAAHAQELEKQLEAVGAGGVEPLRRGKCLHQIEEPLAVAHPDDAAVDALAVLMKAKLAKQRKKGYGGWETPECTQHRLSALLRDHVDKGDPVDVANFCAFLSARGEGIAPQLPVPTQEPQMLTAYSIQRFPSLEFQRWLKRQIPSGTVIGDPEYWASTLWEFMRHEVLRLSALQSDAPQPPAPAQKSDSLLHDEDLLEQLYWDFDHESSKGGQDRLVFKGKLRFYAEHVTSKATAP